MADNIFGFPDTLGAQPRRVSSKDIISQNLKGSNTAIILGDLTHGFIKLDYANRRIIVNDGANDRVVIGLLP